LNDTDARPVAVTGGTGFIGRRLIARLLSAGIPVRALRRRPVDGLEHPLLTWLDGDVINRSTLYPLARGARAVVHCAGVVRGATWQAFEGVNVEGARNIATAAKSTGTRLLCLSSLAAREPALSFYARSKRVGEGAARDTGAEVTTLRPPAVYGPGDKELKPLLDLMWRGVAVVPHHAGRFSLIHVEDVVSAVLAWLDAPACAPGPFELDDGRVGGYTWHDVVEIVGQLTRRRVRLLPVPRPVLMLPASLNALVGKLGVGTPMVTPGKVNELFHTNWVCDSQPFAAATGWQPRIGLEQGLRSLYGDRA
jgi:nucleoside-diphosphate-sugar epimerase